MVLPEWIVYPLHRGRQMADAARAELFLCSILLRCRLIRKRLVVITLLEHIGDIVACEPVARQVRLQEPDAFIVWCVKRQYQELVAHHPALDAIVKVRCLTTWIWLRKSGFFDRIIDLHISGRVCPICRVPLEKEEGAPGVTLENYFDFGPLLIAFCRVAGIEVPEGGPCLTIPQAKAARVAAIVPSFPYLVIHCSSNESSKDWTSEGWNAFIDALVSRYDVAIVEVGLVSELNRLDSACYQNRCGNLSLLESAELIRRATLFVGVDSGPAHIANAVGTYGVVLMGSYRTFASYTPFTGGFGDGSNATLITVPGSVADLEPSDVIRVVESLVINCDITARVIHDRPHH